MKYSASTRQTPLPEATTGSSGGSDSGGTVLYGNSSIGSSMAGTDVLRDLTLLIGATPTYPGKVTKNGTTITVKYLRVYTAALTTEQIA